MNREEYDKWLENLKVGDTVVVQCRNAFPSRYRISTVEYITPKRQIKVKGESNKFKNGTELTTVGSYEFKDTIIPLTDEVQRKIDRAKYLDKIQKTVFKDLETEQLKNIYNIICGE